MAEGVNTGTQITATANGADGCEEPCDAVSWVVRDPGRRAAQGHSRGKWTDNTPQHFSPHRLNNRHVLRTGSMLNCLILFNYRSDPVR